MFEPGKKVICINDSFNPKTIRNFSRFPHKGEILTIKEIKPDEGLIFNEIDAKEEWGFWAWRFKPVFEETIGNTFVENYLPLEIVNIQK